MKCSIDGSNNRGGKVIDPKNLDSPLVNLCLEHRIEGLNELNDMTGLNDLMTLSKMRKSSMIPIETGKGMMIEIANPIPKYTNNQMR